MPDAQRVGAAFVEAFNAHDENRIRELNAERRCSRRRFASHPYHVDVHTLCGRPWPCGRRAGDARVGATWRR
jgi:hypothetical protein